MVVECKLSEYLAQSIACGCKRGKSLSIECNGTIHSKWKMIKCVTKGQGIPATHQFWITAFWLGLLLSPNQCKNSTAHLIYIGNYENLEV